MPCQLLPLCSKLQKRGFTLTGELSNVSLVFSQERCHIRGGAVAGPNPQDLGWRALQDAQSMKVFVFRGENAIVLARKLPYLMIRPTAGAQLSHVQRAWKDVGD